MNFSPDGTECDENADCIKPIGEPTFDYLFFVFWNSYITEKISFLGLFGKKQTPIQGLGGTKNVQYWVHRFRSRSVKEEPIFLERSASLKLDTDIGEIQMRRKRNLMEKGDGVDGGDRGEGDEGCGHWGRGRRRNWRGRTSRSIEGGTRGHHGPKKHSFSLVAYSSWQTGVPLQKCVIFHWQSLSSIQSPNQQGRLEVVWSGWDKVCKT